MSTRKSLDAQHQGFFYSIFARRLSFHCTATIAGRQSLHSKIGNPDSWVRF
jgi:hypothetical protein